MHLNHLQHTTPSGYWTADWARTCSNYHDANQVIATHNPGLITSLERVLNEATYKELATLIDPNFLSQRLRAAALRGVRLDGWQDRDTMRFYVTSSEIDLPGTRGFQKEYVNLVKFTKWDEIGGDPDLLPFEKAMMMLWVSDIKLFCDDPSFLYWGYQYILTVLDSSIYDEIRFPGVRNPQERGICCKHLNRVLKALPFYSGDIAKEIINQWGGRADKKTLDAIRRRLDASNQVNGMPPEEPEEPPEEEPEEPVV